MATPNSRTIHPNDVLANSKPFSPLCPYQQRPLQMRVVAFDEHLLPGYAFLDTSHIEDWVSQEVQFSAEDAGVTLYNLADDKIEDFTLVDAPAYVAISHVWDFKTVMPHDAACLRGGKGLVADEGLALKTSCTGCLSEIHIEHPSLESLGLATYDTQLTSLTNINLWQRLRLAYLRRLLLSLGVTHIWLDFVCVLQTSTHEQRRATRLMGAWYANARNTLVWLADTMLQAQNIRWVTRAIETTLWWNRVWTVQECRLSKNLVFMDARGVVDLGYAGDFCRDGWFDVGDALYRLTTRVHEEWSPAMALLETRRRAATRPHDHIYAALSMIPGATSNIEISYQITVAEVARRVDAYLARTGDLITFTTPRDFRHAGMVGQIEGKGCLTVHPSVKTSRENTAVPWQPADWEVVQATGDITMTVPFMPAPVVCLGCAAVRQCAAALDRTLSPSIAERNCLADGTPGNFTPAAELFKELGGEDNTDAPPGLYRWATRDSWTADMIDASHGRPCLEPVSQIVGDPSDSEPAEAEPFRIICEWDVSDLDSAQEYAVVGIEAPKSLWALFDEDGVKLWPHYLVCRVVGKEMHKEQEAWRLEVVTKCVAMHVEISERRRVLFDGWVGDGGRLGIEE
ncbi:hypothetical protein HDV00_003604 [Rhizophlyctis rosea]|nr:hypothetical protein HDV00_003604 [Rhizophlyctis rosea]